MQSQMPARRNDLSKFNSRKVLEAAGIKFSDLVPGNPIFQYVDLPPGWKNVPRNGFTDLVDNKGRTRAFSFYIGQEAFYTAKVRYSVKFDSQRLRQDDVAVAHVMDGDRIVYTTEPFKDDLHAPIRITPYSSSPFIQVGDEKQEDPLWKQAMKAAQDWLDKKFPNWEDPSAYWD